MPLLSTGAFIGADGGGVVADLLASATNHAAAASISRHPTSFVGFEKVALCEDLDDMVLRRGESCYSDCGATNAGRIL